MGLRDYTLCNVMERNRRLYGDRLAFVAGNARITHGEYATKVVHLAAGFLQLGLEAGDRVAVLARNCLEYVEIFGAAARLGLIVVPVNWRLTADEIEYVIADTTPSVVVVDADYAPLIEEMRARLGWVQHYFVLGAGCNGFDTFGGLYRRDTTTAAADIPASSPLMILQTAAVGGRPRGAVLSHMGLLTASLQQGVAWGMGPRDVNLGVLPLFHVSGISLLLATQQAGGATIILPDFDPRKVVGAIAAERATVCATFPPMLATLLDSIGQEYSQLSSLRHVIGIDSPETIARFESVCRSACFWVAYGQSEVSGAVTLAPFRERPGSAGRPGTFADIAVVDDLDRPVPTGQTGELVIRGPMVFNGYWGRDLDNELTFRNDWHHTGDLGRFDDDGYVWYAGPSPAKELIKSGGENVYPAEVERILLEHPSVVDAAVFGVPDPKWGEAIRAVCVLRAGSNVAADALIEFTGARIARYKRPKRVVFVSALPRNSMGMLDRSRLKKDFGDA